MFPTYFTLDLQHRYAPSFPFHLVHPTISQSQVGLHMVAGQGEAEEAKKHDDPQAEGIVRGVRHTGNKTLTLDSLMQTCITLPGL